MKCPTCGKPVSPDDLGQPGSTFPFCSGRCRDVDLGRWLDGKYQIPVEIDDQNDDDPPPLPRKPRD